MSIDEKDYSFSDADELDMAESDESHPAPDLMDSWMSNLHDPLD